MATPTHKKKEEIKKEEELNPVANLINKIAALVQEGKGPSKLTVDTLFVAGNKKEPVVAKRIEEIEVNPRAVQTAEALAAQLENGTVRWPETRPRKIKEVN